MQKGDKDLTPHVLYANTKAAIEALAGVLVGSTAYATDYPTAPFGTYTGASWEWQPVAADVASAVSLKHAAATIGATANGLSIAGQEISLAAATAATPGAATAAQITKLDGIEAGAEVNNISDVNATDLTDGGATTLHTHGYQPLDAGLTSLAALPTAADKIAYSTAADAWAETAITAAARALLGSAGGTAGKFWRGDGVLSNILDGVNNQLYIATSGVNRFVANVGGSVFDFSTLPNATAASRVRFFRLTTTSSAAVGVIIYKPDGSGMTEEAYLSATGGNSWLNLSGGNVGVGTKLAGAGVTYQKLSINGSQLFVGTTLSQEREMAIFVPSYVSNVDADYTTALAIKVYNKSGALTAISMSTTNAAGGNLPKLSLYGGTDVIRGVALTTQLPTITHTAPGTPDYALQDLVNSSAGACFGFATKDEGNSLLKVVANLQVRVAEIDARLNSATGINAWA